MKRFMKTSALVVASIVSILSFAGCSPSTPTNPSPSATPNAAANGQALNFRLSDTHPEGYPTVDGDHAFADAVNKATNGRIKIQIFANGTLGDEASVVSQVQMGAIDLARVSTGAMASFNKDFGVFSLPYLFDNDTHLWKFLNADNGGKQLLNSLSNSKMYGLAFYEAGSRSFYTRKPINSPSDLKGLKIRTQSDPIIVDMMKTLGATAVPLGMSEVYSALQTGTIDGAENNVPTYFSDNDFQVAKYFIEDEHLMLPECTVISKTVMDKLSPQDQKVIRDAAAASVDVERKSWAAYDQKARDEVKAKGINIVPVPDKTPWKAAVKPMFDKYAAQYTNILKAIDDARK